MKSNKTTMDLSGKVAVISGSTGGIGLEIAKHLAKAGASIVLTGRTETRVQAAGEKLKEALGGCNMKVESRGIVGDLGTKEGCDTLIQAVPEADILVNNLGIFEPRQFFDISDEEWEKMFSTNVMSGVRLSRHYLKGMLAKNWGRIVFISSESGMNIPTEMIHYGMSKTAQFAVARGIAELTKHSAVTCNSLAVGPTWSEGVEAYMKKLAEHDKKPLDQLVTEFFKEHRPTSLIQRFLTEEEVASAAAYLCSHAASGTNGSAMRVDGGLIRTVI